MYNEEVQKISGDVLIAQKATSSNYIVVDDVSQIDFSKSNVYKLILKADSIFPIPAEIIAGITYTIIVQQDTIGNRILTFPNTYVFPKSDSGSLISTANGITIITLKAIDNSKIYGELLLPSSGGGGGSGSVTEVSVVTANGISGTVANATTTPAITVSLTHIAPNSATITPLDDRQALTIRRNSVGQVNHILDVQTEANGPLAYIDKDGNFVATNVPLSINTDVSFLTPTTITYATAFPFDKALTMMFHILDANDTLTVNSTGAVDGAGGWIEFTNNGINEPILNAFKTVSGSYDKTKAYSLLVFARVNGKYTVSITNYN